MAAACEHFGRNVRRGGAMSAFGKSLSTAIVATTLVAWTAVSVVSAQGPWVAPADAKAAKNPVKGVGKAKKTVETNSVEVQGAAEYGGEKCAAAVPKLSPS